MFSSILLSKADHMTESTLINLALNNTIQAVLLGVSGIPLVMSCDLNCRFGGVILCYNGSTRYFQTRLKCSMIFTEPCMDTKQL